MDNTVIVAVILTVANLLIAIGGWLGARDSREKIKGEGEKVRGEADKVKEETRQLNESYWREATLDMRQEMKLAENRYTSQLLTQAKKHAYEMGNMLNAFNYLCEEVRGEYPTSVTIAQAMAKGRVKPGDRMDDSSSSDAPEEM